MMRSAASHIRLAIKEIDKAGVHPILSGAKVLLENVLNDEGYVIEGDAFYSTVYKKGSRAHSVFLKRREKRLR